ncbi:MAG: cytochrome c biogenesis protein CcsA [Prevotella sp.]|nr:cytochrome c biogenesis protein CcsA [Prevotella sp.]
MGWNIFPMWAAIVILLAATSATLAIIKKERSTVAMAMMLLAILGMAGFIAMLWMVLERPPLRTMGETRLWYSFFLLVAGLFTYYRWQYRWIMLFSTVLASVFVIINIVKPEIHDHTLMPALQSVWFVPHVSVYMFSYSMLGCATLLSTVALVRRSYNMDIAIEKLLYAGLAFLTMGMLTGSLWAKEAWGAYWSWDAKESWAVATWALYLLALHFPPQKRLKDNAISAHLTNVTTPLPCGGVGGGSAYLYHIIIILGFLALQMCWYGINYLPSAETSIHTYNQ